MRPNEAASKVTVRYHWTAAVLDAARTVVGRAREALAADLSTTRFVTFGVLATLLTSAVVTVFYFNHPAPEVYPTSNAYLDVAHRIQSGSHPIDSSTLPGYALLMVLVFQVTGQDNFLAVSILQGVLFVAAAVELYIIAAILTRRAWLACVLMLSVGGNIALIAGIKPILPEGLTLPLTMSWTLALVLVWRRPSVANIWVASAGAAALVLTQLEAAYLLVPLALFFVWAVMRHGRTQRLLPHIAGASVALALVMVGYASANLWQTGYGGVSDLTNVDVLGKVMQYHMEGEAPQQYSQQAQIIHTYVAAGGTSPFAILDQQPTLSHDHFALAGAFASAVIQHHPVEFIVKSAVVAQSSLSGGLYSLSPVQREGPFAGPLLALESLAAAAYTGYQYFLACALLWLGLFCWPRTRLLHTISALLPVFAVTGYDLIAFTLTDYTGYAQLHIPFDPLMSIVVWGTAAFGVAFIARLMRAGLSGTQLPAIPRGWHPRAGKARPRLEKGGLSIATVAQALRRYRAVWWGAMVMAITLFVVVAFYLNHPQVEAFPDTSSYLRVSQGILTHLNPVDPMRTPGYPMLIAIVTALSGGQHLALVSAVQGVLYIAAALEVYVLALLVLRQPWSAAIVALLVGANVTIISFVKPLLPECLALWLTVSLALALALFVRSVRARTLWLVYVCLLALFFTRSEWEYAPIPLGLFALVVAARHGQMRRLLPHALGGVLAFYAVLGAYVAGNAAQYGFVGATDIPNINLLGKVMQYQMQDEAPPQYAAQAHVVDAFMAQGATNPYTVVDAEPSFSRNYYALAGAYASAVVRAHPVQFVLDSLPVAVSSLTDHYYARSPIDPVGAFEKPLLQLQAFFVTLYNWNKLFLICGAAWLGAFLVPRLRRSQGVELMVGVVLVAFYDLMITTFGAYDDYPRFHIPFDPLLIVTTWVTVLFAVLWLVPRLYTLWVPAAIRLRLSATVAAASPPMRVGAEGWSAGGAGHMLAGRTRLAQRRLSWSDLAWRLPESVTADRATDLHLTGDSTVDRVDGLRRPPPDIPPHGD